MLAALVADGGTAAILECSSHALVLERLAGCSFDVAIFLNLSRDHLDFHRDMDDYFEAKARLFSMLKPGERRSSISETSTGAGSRVDWSPDRTVGFFLEGEEGVEQTRPAALAGAVARERRRLRRAVSSRRSSGARRWGSRERASRSRSRPHSPSKKKRSGSKTPLKRERTDEPGALLTIDSPLLGRSNAENLLAAAAAGVALGFRPPRSPRASSP